MKFIRFKKVIIYSVILICLVIQTNLSCAQQIKEYKEYYDDKTLLTGFTMLKDGKIVKTGEWKIYYDYAAGEIFMVGHYKNDLPIGKWKGYYPENKIFIEGEYDQSLGYVREVGKWNTYWRDGKIANNYSFDGNGNKSIEVVNTKYTDEYKYPGGAYGKGEMLMSVAFEMNVDGDPHVDFNRTLVGPDGFRMGYFMRTGHWKEYSADGVLMAEGVYNPNNNKPYGLWKVYRENGKLKNEKTYDENGNQNGIVRYYYSDGPLLYEGIWKGDYYYGKGTNYYKDGSIDYIEEFDENMTSQREYFYPDKKTKSKGSIVYLPEKEKEVEQGSWIYYHQNGKTQAKGVFHYGDKEGDWTYYFDSGSIDEVIEYENGKITRYLEQYLKDGSHTLQDGNGLSYNFYDSGEISSKLSLKNGIRDGICTWYYKNGQIDQSALYKYDESTKPYGLRWEIISSFTPSGKSRKKGDLKNGNGSWINYNEDGSISHISTYQNGILVNKEEH